MNRYDSYKDSGVEWIGEIPRGWENTKLKFILEGITTGGTPDTSKDNYWGDEENGINWISISDITSNGRVILETKKYISEEGLESKRLEVLPIGSLIYSIYGSIGKVSRLGIPSTIHQGILGLKTNSIINSTFLEYYLIYFKEYVSLFSSSNTQENLNQEKVSNFEIPLPPLNEQQEIVSYLDNKTSSIDSLIQSKEKKIELLKEKRTSLINQFVTKGLNPDVEMKDSGVEWIGEIPSEWDISRVKLISDIKRGSSPRPIDDPVYFDEDGEYSWVRISDVSSCGKYLTTTTQKLSDVGKNHSLPLENETLCMSISGSVGKVFITKIKCCIHDGFVSFNNLKLEQEYLYLLLTNDELYSEDRKLGTQYNINSEIVGNKRIPLPPLNEQHQIVEYLDKETKLIDETISSEHKKIELLKEYKQSLISEVVTGKRKVTTDE